MDNESMHVLKEEEKKMKDKLYKSQCNKYIMHQSHTYGYVQQWWAVTFQSEDAVQKSKYSLIFKLLFYFSLLFVKFTDNRRIFRYFSNLTLDF